MSDEAIHDIFVIGGGINVRDNANRHVSMAAASRVMPSAEVIPSHLRK